MDPQALGQDRQIPLSVRPMGKWTIVEFRTASLMDVIVLEKLSQRLYSLIDEQDRRLIILDFERVQYLSSQAIGLIIGLHKRLAKSKGGQLILCSVGERLMQLIKIVKLEKLLTIKPTQKEAVNAAMG